MIIAVVGVLALGGGIIELTGGGEEEAKPAAKTSEAAKPDGGGVPTPDAGQAAAYLEALRGIDPGLVVNEERAIRRGRAICDRIINPPGGKNMTLAQYTVAELSGGNATINQAQAYEVIKAVKVWCPA